MKTIKHFLLMTLIGICLTGSVKAQNNTNSTTTQGTTYHSDMDNNSSGMHWNWGWIGLVGLLGLFGRRPRNNNTIADTRADAGR